jgi:hypothetical protein
MQFLKPNMHMCECCFLLYLWYMLNLNTMSQGQQKQKVVDNMYPTVFISDLKHTLFTTERSTGSGKDTRFCLHFSRRRHCLQQELSSFAIVAKVRRVRKSFFHKRSVLNPGKFCIFLEHHFLKKQTFLYLF